MAYLTAKRYGYIFLVITFFLSVKGITRALYLTFFLFLIYLVS